MERPDLARRVSLGSAIAPPHDAAQPVRRVLWAFARPHTIVGTVLCVGAIVALVVAEQGGAAPGRVAAIGLGTLAAALAANVFIVGLNQLVDVPIDRVNKPDLPLPAGHLAKRDGRHIVAVAGALALGLGAAQGPWLVITLGAGMAIGAAYSLPPLRLKGSAAGAPLAIALVRGPIANLGLAAHVGAALGGPAWPVPPGVLLLALFMTPFALAIGLAKDLPDLDGDRAFAVGNLAVRAGPRRALAVAVGLLVAAYGGTALVAIALLPMRDAALLAAAHAVVLYGIARRARALDVRDRGAVRRAYAALWRLVYAEHVLLPAIALAASSGA